VREEALIGVLATSSPDTKKEYTMFRIPAYYQEEVTFAQGWDAMKQHGRGDALEGMNAMQRVWEEHCASPGVHCDLDDDEFWDNYAYEANAYNVVFTNMYKLFGEAA